ncbi:von Willebrand factor-like [Contarinia nasturtii]|uniref:von Willebrand factor-like n=1 Tax=Contarinia nasturtii TaxID=265458 RepID=UPI0012D46BD8|nr:von Willebrand factor-like [Contarinia nasturtii]
MQQYATCPAGQVYADCSKWSYRSCGDVFSSYAQNFITSCDASCRCPEGQAFDANNNCISVTECKTNACIYNGVQYAAGSKIEKDCNTCTCDNGQFACSNKQCPGECKVWGDLHYKTFDGTFYNHLGKESYHMLKVNDSLQDVDVITHHGPCLWEGAEDSISCVARATLNAKYSGQSVSIDFNTDSQASIVVNGVDRASNLPLTLLNGHLRLRREDTNVVSATFSDRLKVTCKSWKANLLWVTINAPVSYVRRTSGMCGLYDGDQTNDLQTPEGLTQNATNVGNSWCVKEVCSTSQWSGSPVDTCAEHPERKQKALVACSYLKNESFSGCTANISAYYDACMLDLYSVSNDAQFEIIKNSAYAAYASECTFSISDVRCPAGQVYADCSKWSYRSCGDVLSLDAQNFSTSCAASCRCPEGQAFNAYNQCVATKDCGNKTQMTVPVQCQGGEQTFTQVILPNTCRIVQ